MLAVSCRNNCMKRYFLDFLIDMIPKVILKITWNYSGSLYVIVSTPGDMPLKIESQGNGDAKMKFVDAWLSLFAKALFSGEGHMGEGKNMLFQGVAFWMPRQGVKLSLG